MPFIQPEQLAQIVAFVINNYQPSLPSDIDEAELKYVESMDNPPANQEEERIIYQTFKAGAEWMAKQGETIFDTIVIDGQGQRWLTDNLLLGDYDCGEEVIVQIRKK